MDSRANRTAIWKIASNEEVFESFYREHLDAVKRFIARRVYDPYLVADLTADVFVAAIGSASAYDPRRGDPRAWLWGIARNVVADEVRRTAKDRRAAGIVVGRELVDDGELAAMHDRIDAESSSRALYREMARLSEADRAVLELVALDGLKVHEAAAALGITPVAARVRLHRARRRLRDQLQHLQFDYNVKEVVQ